MAIAGVVSTFLGSFYSHYKNKTVSQASNTEPWSQVKRHFYSLLHLNTPLFYSIEMFSLKILSDSRINFDLCYFKKISQHQRVSQHSSYTVNVKLKGKRHSRKKFNFQYLQISSENLTKNWNSDICHSLKQGVEWHVSLARVLVIPRLWSGDVSPTNLCPLGSNSGKNINHFHHGPSLLRGSLDEICPLFEDRNAI